MCSTSHVAVVASWFGEGSRRRKEISRKPHKGEGVGVCVHRLSTPYGQAWLKTLQARSSASLSLVPTLSDTQPSSEGALQVVAAGGQG